MPLFPTVYCTTAYHFPQCQQAAENKFSWLKFKNLKIKERKKIKVSHRIWSCSRYQHQLLPYTSPIFTGSLTSFWSMLYIINILILVELPGQKNLCSVRNCLCLEYFAYPFLLVIEMHSTHLFSSLIFSNLYVKPMD